MDATVVQRGVVAGLSVLDEAIDSLAYRPAVVRGFRWLPRWWRCDAAKVSVWLDEHWGLGWWREHGLALTGLCAACRRREGFLVIEAPNGTEVPLCGWCRVEGQILSADDLERALAVAGAESMSWRWR